MRRFVLLAASAVAFVSAPASAAVVFSSSFEGAGNSDNLRTGAFDPNATTPVGDYGLYLSADGWTATGVNNPIELQNNVAGTPAPTGGSVFVELDSTRNSSMSRTIGAGVYDLSFLYSPRPNVAAASNGIEVLLNGVVFNPPGVITGGPLGGTSWSTYTINGFSAAAASTLTFRAVGGDDSLGGYVDNITLSNAVPEPATWAMMIMGFGLTGAAMRRARKAQVIATA